MVSIYRDMAAVLPPQVTLTLHGALAKYAGKDAALRLYAHTPAAALTGVAAQCPGVEQGLRRGRFHLIAGSLRRGRNLTVQELTAPLTAKTLHLVPQTAGAARGQGKAVLGLTLLGLSMVPGANAAVGSAFGGFGQHIGAGEAFQAFGSQLLGRTGGLLLLAGAAEALTPQAASPAGRLSSTTQAVPETGGQGAAIPLVYGNARLENPPVVSSALDIATTSES